MPYNIKVSPVREQSNVVEININKKSPKEPLANEGAGTIIRSLSKQGRLTEHSEVVATLSSFFGD